MGRRETGGVRANQIHLNKPPKLSSEWGPPHKADEFVNKIREVTVPNYEKKAGYKGCHLFIDRQNNKAIFASYWESEADMHASEQDTGFRSELDDVRSPPESSFYEVISTT